MKKELWRGEYITLFADGSITIDDGVGYIGEEEDVGGLFEALKKYMGKEEITEDQREEEEGCENEKYLEREVIKEFIKPKKREEEEDHQALREESLKETRDLTIQQEGMNGAVWIDFKIKKEYADAWRALLDKKEE